jgi:hypothetical protein
MHPGHRTAATSREAGGGCPTTRHALRRQVDRRAHIVRERTRLKIGVDAILHAT